MRVVNYIEEFWGETGDANADPAYDYVTARLHGRTAPTRIAKPIPAVRLITGIGKVLDKGGIFTGAFHPHCVLRKHLHEYGATWASNPFAQP